MATRKRIFPLAWLRRSPLGVRLRRARVVARNRRAYGLSPPPWLADYDPRAIDADGAIRAAHDEYVRCVSVPKVALSLELAHLLWFLLDRTRPRLILDLGSGFSSYLFRSHQRIRLAAGDPCEVVSCDHDPRWLDRTAEFLARQQLPASGLVLWEQYLARPDNGRPDLILHDLGGMGMRRRTWPGILALRTARTLVIADDVHKSAMRAVVLESVRRDRLACYDLAPVTYDEFGRYAWVVSEARA